MDGIEFRNVLQSLNEEDIPGLPPGGGLESKWVDCILMIWYEINLIIYIYICRCTFIAKTFKDLYPEMADSCEMGNY